MDDERPVARPVGGMSLPPTRIAVLLGGPSAEHEVSLVSGRSIATALLTRGHDVTGWLIDRTGRWWRLPTAALDPMVPIEAFEDPVALGAEGPRSAAAALEELDRSAPRPVVFPALHGPFGEDGEVQSLLGSAGLLYCGSGPAASAVGMDKSIFKRLCGALELPVLPWTEVRAPEHASQPDRVIDEVMAFSRSLEDGRLMCKPARLGSSIGMTIVHRPDDRAELDAAIRVALRYDDLVLLEAYLEHPRELETSLLGNTRQDVRAYGPGEVLPGREFYDYIAKYHSDESVTLATADLAPDLAAAVRAAAIEVFLTIGARGFARVDMLLSADGIPFISEINTIPGFTPISLFPRMTAEAGLDFGATCERIVELALEDAAARSPRSLVPDPLM